MLSFTKRIIKKITKAKDHVVVNFLDGMTEGGEYTRVFLIKTYPPSVIADYLSELGVKARENGATLRKTVRYAPADIKFNWFMNNKIKRLSRSIGTETITDPVRKEEKEALQTILSLRESQSNHSSKLIDYWTFLTVTSPKKYQLDAVSRAFRDWFDHAEAKLDELYREQLEAMRIVSIISDPYSVGSDFFFKKHYGRVITDSVAARTYPFTTGSLSDRIGIYFGRRTEDGSFCLINLCDPNNPSAQNITVCGKTSEGKSFFMKALVVGLLEEGVYVFVFDVNGEWRATCEAAGGVYIDHTAENGRYFEPLTIMPKLEEVDENCVAYNQLRYHRAVESAIRTMSLLADGMNKGELFEAGKAITATFESAGIYKNRPETWDHRDENNRATIHKVFAYLDKEKDKEGEGAHHIATLVDKLKLYFHEDGLYYGMFRTEEEQTFLKNPLVVYKVGQAMGDNGQDEKAKQAQVKMAMAFDWVNANIQYLKFEGVRFSAVLVDEGQRQLKNPQLRNAVFEWYTSIRHWNGMMILGLNAPDIMLSNPEGKGMWENTSIRAYFYMENSAIRTLASDTDVPLEIQDKIANNQGTYKFILENHGRFDELKMDVPPEEAAKYKTRGLRVS